MLVKVILFIATSMLLYGEVDSIMFAGQSNITRLEENICDSDFRLSSVLTSECELDQNIIFSAVGGSAAVSYNASTTTPDNYWVYVDEFGGLHNGPLLNRAIDKLNNSLYRPNYIVWIQGEQDATRIKDLSQKSIYKSATIYIFNKLLSHASKDAKVLLSTIGRRVTQYGISDASDSQLNLFGQALVRQAQVEIARELDSVVLVSNNYDLNLEPEVGEGRATDVHYSYEGQREFVSRLIKYVEDKRSISYPSIESASFDGKTFVTVSFGENIISSDISFGAVSRLMFMIVDKNGNKVSLIKGIYRSGNQLIMETRENISSIKEDLYLATAYSQMRYGNSEYVRDISTMRSSFGVTVNGVHILPTFVKIKEF